MHSQSTDRRYASDGSRVTQPNVALSELLVEMRALFGILPGNQPQGSSDRAAAQPRS